jgi:hypothetical protein
MRSSRGLSGKLVAAGLVIFLAVPFAETAAAQPQEALSGRQPQTATQTAALAQPKDTVAEPQGAQAATPPSAPDQNQNGGAKPVGTAAAPLEKTTGVSASRPAGAVIAPAKQRRARAIFIRVAVVVAAAAAVGAVIGLSKTNNGRPDK